MTTQLMIASKRSTEL